MTTIANNESYAYPLQGKHGIIMITATANDVERIIILPVYVQNKYCHSIGSPIMDYSYNNKSRAITYSLDETNLLIQNDSGIAAAIKVTEILIK